MTISSAWDLSSDAELITAVRSGESAAFGVLYERHAAAARAVARQYSNSAPDAEDAVSDAFSRVFAAVQAGGGPDVAFRAYLFTVVRRVALTRIEGGRRAVLTDDLETFESAAGSVESSEDPTMAGFERGIVSHAYKSLPERWQAVLWYTEVEELSPAQIAPILGLTANGVAALAYRAREGLRQAYLQQHLAAPRSEACTIVNGKLGAYVRGGLAKRETSLVEMHLEECGACRALVLELGDVNHGMRVVIAPLILGFAAIGVLKGLGFGGVAGSVGTGVGVGVGSGAAAGATAAASGTGVGAGATGGSLVGSGAAGSGLAAAGTGVAGTGVAALVGAPAAGATVAISASAATGGAGAAASGTPFAFIAAAAAAVVVAGAVAVAGFLGLFTPDSPGGAEAVAAEESAAPDDESAADPNAADHPTAADPTPDPVTGTDVPVDPADLPVTDGVVLTDPAEVPADTTRAPAGQATTSSDPGTAADPVVVPPVVVPPVVVPPVQPPVAPPASLVLSGGLGDIAFTAGADEQIQLGVTNTGGVDAPEVRLDLGFPEDVEFDLSVAAPPTASGMARGAPAPFGWTCEEKPAENLASCSIADLAAGSTSTLTARLSMTVPGLVDAERSVPVALVAWLPGGGDRPEPTLVATRVVSSPAQLRLGQIAPVDVVGSLTPAEPAGTVVIPLTNTGGTTALDVPVTVALPTLPTGLTVTGAVPGSCLEDPTDNGLLTCTVAAVRPGSAGSTLVLALTTDTTLVNLAGNRVELMVSAAGESRPALVTLSSAPAAYTVGSDDLVLVTGAPQALPVVLRNTGLTDGVEVAVRVALPAGMRLAPSSTGWGLCPGFTSVVCTVVSALPALDAVTLPLPLVSPAGAIDSGTYQLTLSAVDRLEASASGIASVTVAQTPARLVIEAPAVTFDPGEPTAVRLLVRNDGGSSAKGVQVVATGQIPSVRYDSVVAPSDWDCDEPGRVTSFTLTCDLLGSDLPGGTTTELAFRVVAMSNTGGREGIGFTVTADELSAVTTFAAVTAR